MATKNSAPTAQADEPTDPTPGPTPEPVDLPEVRTDDYQRFLNDYARTPFHSEIAAAESKYGLPVNLLARQLWAESRFNPAAVSPVGAVGIAQFMPATAADYNLDPTDPHASIIAAAKYMRSLRRSSGVTNWYDALVAYNWGIGNVQKHGTDSTDIPEESYNYATGIVNDSEAEE